MSTTAKESLKGILHSLGEINKLAIKEVGSICEMQRDALAFYQDVSLRQLRAASEIDSAESLKQAVSSAVHAAGDVARYNVENCKSLLHIGSEFREAVADAVRHK